MNRWKSQGLLFTVLSLAMWLGGFTASGSAQDAGDSSGVSSGGPSTIQIITRDASDGEESEGSISPAEPPEEGAPMAEASAGQPTEEPAEQPAEPASPPTAPAAEPAPEESPESASLAPEQAIDQTDSTPQALQQTDEEPLVPIPDPQSSGVVAVETAGFNGIIPGVSTLAEVAEAWGAPREIANRNAQLVHLYTIEPFEQVEVSFVKEQVAAIVIRLERAFPADLVAEKLELSEIRPVLISDELGHVLGQAFPERGVMFAFKPSETPGKASMRVTQIVLEPVAADAFVLRAETYMNSEPGQSIRDLEEAIQLDASNARAHWLKARLLAAQGDTKRGLEASSEAIRLEPSDPQYRLTRAQILGQVARFDEAVEEAQQAAADSTKRPHLKAQALCLLGDLRSSQPQPDYRKALEHHMEAIQTADPLAVSRHPDIRIGAKEVLIDAHLGAGHDIAWGPWDQKEKAVPRWLEQAADVASDLIEQDNGSPDHQFRVASRALAALVGLRGKLDPSPWTEELLRAGQEVIAATRDSAHKKQLRWDLGMALYDVVQIYQMRGDHEAALTYGKRAIGYLEPGAVPPHAKLSDVYLLGRLYFRLGAIHAVGQEDHAAAIDWFEKAIPVFDRSVDQLAQSELGRLGETFVSIGVSFWENGDKDRAVELTQRGVELMEKAVGEGTLQESALEIPYGNLATMARSLGKADQADKYLQEAKKHRPSALR
jgi:tetratricopeptide (TPR) repeat protein